MMQMALCIMVIARVASIPLWMRSKPWAGFLLILLHAFMDRDRILALYQTVLETLFSNLFASALFIKLVL